MGYFLEQVLNGLLLGAVYGLVAVGFSLIYGVARLMNFAHGEFFMVGAFAGLFAAKVPVWKLGLGPVATLAVGFLFVLVASMAASAVLAVVVERVAYRPVRRVSRMGTFLVALGTSLLLQHLGFRLFSASPRAFPDIVLALDEVQRAWLASSTALTLSGGEADFLAGVSVAARARDAVTLGLLVIAALGAVLFTYKTDTGLAVRAYALDEDAATALGVRGSRATAWTFAVGGALAGLAGLVWALRYGGVQPLMGFLPGLKAFVAAVVGGFGSVPGALLGGLLLGSLEALSTAYLSAELSGYRDAVTLSLLIVFLLIRPRGILGTKLGESA